MGSTSIQTLRANVSQEDAVRIFRSGGVSAAYWRLRCGPLRRIADVYVPFWLYRVQYEMNGGKQTRIFAMDAVHGALDLYEFPGVPGADRLVSMETRNRMEARLAASEAEERLRTKVLRVLFQQGFFKLKALKLTIERMPLEIHLPYWLGFYGSGETARLRAMDAIRRRIEGGKASAFFEEWLAA
jgi:hypothetical protein